MKKEMSIILLILSLALPGATGFQTTTGILKIMSSRNSSSSRMPMPARTRTAKYTRTVLFGERAIQAAMEAEARYGPDSPQAQLAWRSECWPVVWAISSISSGVFFSFQNDRQHGSHYPTNSF